MASKYFESEIAQLLREVASRPEVAKSQRDGFQIFWDKQVDFEAMERFNESEIPPKGYVYDASPPEPGQSKPPFFALGAPVRSSSGL